MKYVVKEEMIATASASDVIEVTKEVKRIVEQSGIKEGNCLVFVPHTTAALTTTSFWDPKGFDDLKEEISRLIPTRIDFQHQFDTPQDAAGHVKSSLMGISLPFIVHEGKLMVGGSQGIFFLEFDGPRKRKYIVQVGGNE